MPDRRWVRRRPGGCAGGGAWRPGRFDLPPLGLRVTEHGPNGGAALVSDDPGRLPAHARARCGLLRAGVRALVCYPCAPASAGGPSRAAAGRCAGRERGHRHPGRGGGRGRGPGWAGSPRSCVRDWPVRRWPTSTRPAPGWRAGCTGSTRPPTPAHAAHGARQAGQGGDGRRRGAGWVRRGGGPRRLGAVLALRGCPPRVVRCAPAPRAGGGR